MGPRRGELCRTRPPARAALADEKADETAHELAITAQGIAKAAQILASQFTLTATNVPTSAGVSRRGPQRHNERVHTSARADLATCFVERCMAYCASGGSSAIVSPQNWLYLGAYKAMRVERLTADSGFLSPSWVRSV